MFSLWSCIGVLLFLVTLGYCYLKWHYRHWARRAVSYEQPHLFWGNIQGVGKKCSLSDKVQSVYEQFSDQSKVCGFFLLVKPLLIICDLDLVKAVLIKDFHKLSDRGWFYNEKHDPLSANLFSLPEDRWKFLRSKLSPTFSSGKLRAMTSIVAKLSDKLVSKIRESNGESVNSGNLFARYTTDVIGNCAFGLDCNSLEDPASEFLRMGNMVFRPANGTRLRMQRMIVTVFGSFSRKLGVVNTQSEVSAFFYNVAKQSVDYREKEHVQREDFLNSLIQMKSNSELTFDEVAAQMFLFQMAGYETSSTTLTFAGYELAMNEDVQEKAREEVKEVLRRNNNELSFEAIFEMSYLERVVSEALRKYPPGRMLLRRVAADEYNLPGIGLQLKKNDLVAIPVFAIHRDPAIYPEPERFDPDRFLPEEIQNRHSMAYLPWGEGPRNCLGMRFAIMEIKIALCKILLNFRLERGEDLPEKLEFSPRGIVMTPKCDINIRYVAL